jgi:uncharacterized protein
VNLSAAPTSAALGPLRPLAAGSVTLRGGLLGERAATNVRVSLPHGYTMLAQRGALDHLRRAAGQPGRWPPPPVRDSHVEKIYDSDIYKWLEAVAWSWHAAGAEPVIADYAEVVRLLRQAQQPDGYLQSWVQVRDPSAKLRDWKLGHELYCWGHLIQAAVAAKRSAGRGDLLQVAARVVGYLDRVDARAPDGAPVVPAHPGIETALVELYRTTGEAGCLELASTFLNRRGYGSIGGWAYGPRYFRDDKPVRRARTAGGHAVMALYLISGSVDVAVETGDRSLLEAASSQWSDMVARRMYLTGGVGSRHYEEGFGDAYELPPDHAYCETCAAVATVMAGWRLLLATGDERISDVIERVMFNTLLAGVSLSGDGFTYVNPLQVRPDHLGGVNEIPGVARPPWFECACCPPNLMRMLATIQECLVSISDEGLHIHQYASADVTAPDGDGRQRSLEIRTGYPWSGLVVIDVRSAGERSWTLTARIPSWCRAARVEVRAADGTVQLAEVQESGPIRLTRRWTSETVTLTFDLRPSAVVADRRVDAARDCIAFQRGPVVYCLEQPPEPPGAASHDDIAIDPAAPVTERPLDSWLPGAPGLEVQGWQFIADDANGDEWPYRYLGSAREGTWQPAPSVLVPYFAWGNRGTGPMRVWLPIRCDDTEGSRDGAEDNG